jgi:hypothetical protein
MKGFERQAGMVNQIRSQLNQIQKHILKFTRLSKKDPLANYNQVKRCHEKRREVRSKSNEWKWGGIQD